MPIIREKLQCCYTKDSALLSLFFVALVVSRSVLPAALMQRQAAGRRFYFGLRFLFPPSPQLAPAANRCILQSLIIIDQPSLNTHFPFRPLSKFQRFLFSSLRPQVSNLVSMISIIIPNYNGAKFLREAIDSALDQQGVELEVIVVDDGSTDDSRAILESYGGRIRPYFQKNKGASTARNVGLKMAEGDYVKFLDADDWLIPDALSIEFQAAESYQDSERPIIVFGDALECREGQQSPWQGHRVVAGEALSLIDLVDATMLTTLPLHLTKALRAVDGFDTKIPSGEDFDLSFRLHLSGARFVYQPGPSFVYRQHAEGERVSTSQYPAAHFEARLEAYQRNVSDAQAACEGVLSQDLAKSLARLIWETGRLAARCAHPKEARRFFNYALELTGGDNPGQRFYYRCCCCLMGAVITERLLGLFRR